MVLPVGQPRVALMDYYQPVLNEIVDDHGIQRVEGPGHIVSAHSEWVEVCQHTQWFVGGSADSKPHYRFRRYREMIRDFTASQGREALVDIGCGAGLFSWVFLDWATQQNLGYERIDLYGLDHCPAMLRLALEARQRLLQYLPDYPAFNCSDDVDALCNLLTENHQADTEYTITLGHVLVQAHSHDDIQNFTRVITQVMELLEPGRNCALVAVDADSQRSALAEGWEALLGNLEAVNIHYRDVSVHPTAINDSGRAKRASLFLAR